MKPSVQRSDRLEKILLASAQLFARQGYHGTSTREIARVADISENTLFRHFDHKEDIFWEALRYRLACIGLKRELLDGFGCCEDPRTLVPKIIAQLVDSAVLYPDVLRLVLVAFLEMRWKAPSVFSQHLGPTLSEATDYLKTNIERGRLRDLDPVLIIAAMVTTVLAHPEIVRIMQRDESSFPDSGAAIHQFSNFWLGVLIPTPQAEELVSVAVLKTAGLA